MLDPADFELPPIPPKHYFNIGEVSKLCAVEPTVLRYWEQVFPQLKPVKRRGNRRSYRRHDVKLVRHIRKLLYVDGFTTSGARAQLEQAGEAKGGNGLGEDGGKFVGRLIDELNEVREMLG
ncbi:MAG: MerR family transcriptional regulator [Gammaproteobacteria bacterium]|nr:MerR family transcriptional regulator [Gammaproteobacteria bacterium]